MQIRKRDLENAGYTAGCPGCRNMVGGLPSQAHSEACRKNVENWLKDNSEEGRMRLESATARATAAMDRAAERTARIEREQSTAASAKAPASVPAPKFARGGSSSSTMAQPPTTTRGDGPQREKRPRDFAEETGGEPEGISSETSE